MSPTPYSKLAKVVLTQSSANMIPIATCSPKNSDQVKAYGAEATFDYLEPNCATKIVSSIYFIRETNPLLYLLSIRHDPCIAIDRSAFHL